MGAPNTRSAVGESRQPCENGTMVELYVYPFNDRRHAWEVHASLMREAYGYLVDAGDVALVMRGLDGQYQIGRTDDLGFVFELTGGAFHETPILGAGRDHQNQVRAGR